MQIYLNGVISHILFYHGHLYIFLNYLVIMVFLCVPSSLFHFFILSPKQLNYIYI